MKRYLLLADPDADTRAAVARAAEKLGLSVALADDETEAQKRFLETGPEVVVADILLPRRGPFDFLRRVREAAQGAGVPLLVTSPFRSSANYAQLAEEAGATLLQKPLDGDALAAFLAGLLSGGPREREGAPIWHLGGEVAPEGAFDRHSLPLVFAHACFQAAPCRLAVSRGNSRKVLTIRQGGIAFAVSNLFSDTLARHLLTRSMVSEGEYKAAIAMVTQTPMLIGEAFTRVSGVTRGELDSAIRRNLLEKVLELFTWGEGFYRIIPFDEPPVAIPGGDISGEAVLWSVVNERVSREEIRHTFGHSCGGSSGRARAGRAVAGLSEAGLPARAATVLRATAVAVQRTAFSEVVARSMPEDLINIYFLLLCGYLKLPLDTVSGPVDPRDRARLRELSERHERMKGKNAFQVLGVAADAGDREVEAAYAALKGELGPEAVASLPQTRAARLVACKMEDSWALVKSAHRALATAKSRQAYLATLGDFDFSIGDEGKRFKAEASFRAGLDALTSLDWQKAFDAFVEAASLNPAEPEYRLYAGIARRHQETPTREAALAEAGALVREAAETLAKSAEPHYQLGRIQEALGETEEALESYSVALLRDPDHNRTRRRVRYLAERNPSTLGEKIKKLLKIG